MIRLEVTGGGEDVGLVVESELTPVRIGRGDECEVQVNSRHVSGCHASIAMSGDGYVLRDEGSTNGTHLRRGGQLTAVGAGASGRRRARRLRCGWRQLS